jgi:hypothetical protein
VSVSESAIVASAPSSKGRHVRRVGSQVTRPEKCVVVARMCVLSTTEVVSGTYWVDPCGAVKTIRSDSFSPA